MPALRPCGEVLESGVGGKEPPEVEVEERGEGAKSRDETWLPSASGCCG